MWGGRSVWDLYGVFEGKGVSWGCGVEFGIVMVSMASLAFLAMVEGGAVRLILVVF